MINNEKINFDIEKTNIKINKINNNDNFNIF